MRHPAKAFVALAFVAGLTAASLAPARAFGLDDARAGIAATRRGDLDGAIRLFTRAIESGGLRRKDLAITHNNRGFAYFRQKRHDLAITDFTLATEIRPDYADAHNRLGVVYFATGQYDRAIAGYGKAIELQPNHVHALTNRGDAYTKMGQYRKAIADYTRAIGVKPNAAAYYRRATAHEKFGDRDRAIGDYRAAGRLAPNSPRPPRALRRLGAAP